MCNPGTLLDGIDTPSSLNEYTLGLGTGVAEDASVEQVAFYLLVVSDASARPCSMSCVVVPLCWKPVSHTRPLDKLVLQSLRPAVRVYEFPQSIDN